MFSSFRKTRSGKHTDICLEKVISQETTSSGSGSERSQELGTEKQQLLLRKNTTAITTATMRFNNTLAREKPDEDDCGSYLDGNNIDTEEVAAAITCAVAIVV